MKVFQLLCLGRTVGELSSYSYSLLGGYYFIKKNKRQLPLFYSLYIKYYPPKNKRKQVKHLRKYLSFSNSNISCGMKSYENRQLLYLFWASKSCRLAPTVGLVS
jgi:hypothetical protein